jgi:hypothetical protein
MTVPALRVEMMA